MRNASRRTGLLVRLLQKFADVIDRFECGDICVCEDFVVRRALVAIEISNVDEDQLLVGVPAHTRFFNSRKVVRDEQVRLRHLGFASSANLLAPPDGVQKNTARTVAGAEIELRPHIHILPYTQTKHRAKLFQTFISLEELVPQIAKDHLRRINQEYDLARVSLYRQQR